MEGKLNLQESNTLAVGVYEIPGESAVMINGVPDVISIDNTIPPCNASNNFETKWPNGLGECFKGREVKKCLRGRYYSGTVIDFDKESGRYRVLYQNGVSVDLLWKDLQEVLLPVDVTIPLQDLLQRPFKQDKKSAKNEAQSNIKRRGKKTSN
ncbi:hypothetical protein RJT34_18992 [Clitoria ternatea]|uniref:PTM/DIR17-like Tudor domain-containing protein n=1 Tax=Clitoria ternatea TaxID=43366 RepID=A0AAN9IQ82_CLITE